MTGISRLFESGLQQTRKMKAAIVWIALVPLGNVTVVVLRLRLLLLPLVIIIPLVRLLPIPVIIDLIILIAIINDKLQYRHLIGIKPRSAGKLSVKI